MANNEFCKSDIFSVLEEDKSFMKNILNILLLTMLFIACSKRPKVPHDFPKEHEMARLLADVYLAEATISQSSNLYRGKETEIPMYYKYVLDKHGLTKKQYDTIFAWYSAHPTLLTEVYDEVIQVLNAREAEVKKDEVERPEIERSVPEPGVKNLWEGPRSFVVGPKDTLEHNLPFEFKVDSSQAGIYRLMASHKFDRGILLKEAYMKLIACYSDSTADTSSHTINVSFAKRMANLSLNTHREKYVVSIKGFLLEHDTLVQAKANISNVRLLYFPLDERQPERQ
jgi:hypothetical protein